MNEKKTVLVLDGETRASLAVVRSLGRSGLKVIVASELKNSLAGSSRFCFNKVQYPPPAVNILQFVQSIRDLIVIEKVDVLIPITDASTFAILQNRSLLDNIVSLPLVPFQTYWAASNKISLMKTAAALDIPYPSTIFIDPPSKQSFEQYLVNLKFPVILKPQASIQSDGKTLRKTGVRFAANREDLMQIVSTDESFTVPYMLQEVVTGEGIGIFAFCKKGEILSTFSHRRIREKPPWGGISVVCESTQPDSLALESSRKLLRALNWDGVAMVEFKRDSARNNIPVLMEINARFWGSLQLAIDAGVNFPLYLYQLSQKTDIPKGNNFKPTRSRWLLGDLDHLLIRLKTSEDHPRYPQRLKDKYSAVLTFFLEFLRGSTIEELRYFDIVPFWQAIKTWIRPQ